MFDPFPENMSSETIFYTVSAAAVGVMLGGCILFKVMVANSHDIVPIEGGQSGAILKVKPSLQLPNGEKPREK